MAYITNGQRANAAAHLKIEAVQVEREARRFKQVVGKWNKQGREWRSNGVSRTAVNDAALDLAHAAQRAWSFALELERREGRSAEPQVVVENHGTVASFTPNTDEARKQLHHATRSDGWQWIGDALVVDHRFVAGLVGHLLTYTTLRVTVL